MNKSIKTLTLGATLAALLAGCAVGTPYQRPEVAVPAAWDQPRNQPAVPAGGQQAAPARDDHGRRP